MYEDLELVAQEIERCTVPLFYDDNPAGSGVLVTSDGGRFILTARHVLEDDSGQRHGNELTFRLQLDRPQASVLLPLARVGRVPSLDAAVIDLGAPVPHLGELEQLLEASAVPSSTFLSLPPEDPRIRRTSVYIGGFPEERSWSDDAVNLLECFVYCTAPPPNEKLWQRALSASPYMHCAWIPPTGNKHVGSQEPVPAPVLHGSSGGPWFVVEQHADGPRCRLVAVHSHRVPFRFKGAQHEIAYGIPMLAFQELLRTRPKD